MSNGSEELSVGCPGGGLHTAGGKDGIILAPKFSGSQCCLLQGRESVKKKIASEKKVSVMAVFALSSNFWVLAKGLCPSWSLESILCCSQTKCPCRPALVPLIPLIWKALQTSLRSLPPLCSACSWGSTFPGGPATFSSCLSSHSAPPRLRHVS